jgi:uncharacterized protein
VTPAEISALAGLMFCGAMLYSAVGHGGASAYLAAMALFGVGASVMKPTALVLNLGVSGLATWRFARAGHLRRDLLLPFVAGSVPMAALGGTWKLNAGAYHWLVGVVLLISAAQMIFRPQPDETQHVRPVPPWFAVGAGAGIGFLSGLVGVGGGIFLSPLLLMGRWARIKEASAVAAPFILLNSCAGLAGHRASLEQIPSAVVVWLPAVLLGGWLGSGWGSLRLSSPAIRRLLALVLLIAGIKLLAWRPVTAAAPASLTAAPWNPTSNTPNKGLPGPAFRQDSADI